jgi:hypothetical protein
MIVMRCHLAVAGRGGVGGVEVELQQLVLTDKQRLKQHRRRRNDVTGFDKTSNNQPII